MQRTTKLIRTIATLLTAAVLLTTGAATADDLTNWFDSSDWRSWAWAQEIGGEEELGGTPEMVEEAESSHLSGSRLKAGGLSLLMPGAGQLYNGDRTKGFIMIGVEAVIWGTYIGFDQHGDRLTEDYENSAEIYAGVAGDHSDDYYQSLGRYMDSDAWFDSQLREARAFGEPEPSAPSADLQWQWRSLQHRRDFQSLRADANEAYDRRDMMVLFAIVNRAISVFDAVRNGGQPQSLDEPAMSGEVLGTRLALEVSAPMTRPQARASASWRF